MSLDEENKNQELARLADSVYGNAGELIADGYAPLAVAAVYIMIALQIYKTTLSPEDYQAIVDSISESRNDVRSLTEMVKNSVLKQFH